MTSLALVAPPTHAPPAFNADFYVATVAVIPVLFLALAVQGSIYRNALRATWSLTRYMFANWFDITLKFLTNAPLPGDNVRAANKTTMMIWAGMVTIATFLLVIARFILAFGLAVVLTFGIAIIAAGGYGELLGVYALYQAQDQHTTRLIVLLATMLLIVLVAGGPLITNVLSAFSPAEKSPPTSETDPFADEELTGESDTPPQTGAMDVT
jgi:hypothetical protein